MEELKLISCCERMTKRIQKGDALMKAEKSGHHVRYSLHITQKGKDSTIVYCPFCGRKINFDEWEYK